jgi:CBS domain-containing protein
MRNTTVARDLMSRPVRQLTVETPVRDAAAFLLRHGISGAPVLDQHGQWIGVFTLNDLARCVQRRIGGPRVERSLETREAVTDPLALPAGELGWTPIRKFMTRGLFTVFPEATLEDVVRTMMSFRVHRVFVIDPEVGSLQGVITTMDVLRHLGGKAASGRKPIKALRN